MIYSPFFHSFGTHRLETAAQYPRWRQNHSLPTYGLPRYMLAHLVLPNSLSTKCSMSMMIWKRCSTTSPTPKLQPATVYANTHPWVSAKCCLRDAACLWVLELCSLVTIIDVTFYNNSKTSKCMHKKGQTYRQSDTKNILLKSTRWPT